MLGPRTLSFVVLLSIFLTAVLNGSVIGRTAFMVLAALMAYGAVWEFLNIYGKLGHAAYKKSTAVIGVVVITLAFFQGQKNIDVYGLLALVAAFAWFLLLFGKNGKEYLEKVLNSLVGLVMIMLPLLPLVLIYNEPGKVEGRYMMLFLILVTKAGDTGAYIVGTSTFKIFGGNHKIIPSISPKKSWEGTIGGLTFSTVVSFLLCHYLLKIDNCWFAFIAGTVLFCGGFAGDLVESVLKRTGGVKDSNTIIPGMGGVLDVVDSLMLNAPIFYYIFMPFLR